MRRWNQGVLLVSVAALSWLGMMAVHELGHAVGAWASGGSVVKVVLHPSTISRTDVDPNPNPLLVVWSGPIVGSLLPLVAWGISVASGWRGAFLLKFFAGFCLIANGAYIGLGSFERIGDCGAMLRHGSPPWHLWLFGAVTAPLGLSLWNRLGPSFGFDREKPVEARLAHGCLVAATVLALVCSRFAE